MEDTLTNIKFTSNQFCVVDSWIALTQALKYTSSTWSDSVSVSHSEEPRFNTDEFDSMLDG